MSDCKKSIIIRGEDYTSAHHDQHGIVLESKTGECVRLDNEVIEKIRLTCIAHAVAVVHSTVENLEALSSPKEGAN